MGECEKAEQKQEGDDVYHENERLWYVHMFAPGDIDDAGEDLYADCCYEGDPGVVFAGMQEVDG